MERRGGCGDQRPSSILGKDKEKDKLGGVSKQSLDPVLFLRESTAA